MSNFERHRKRVECELYLLYNEARFIDTQESVYKALMIIRGLAGREYDD